MYLNARRHLLPDPRSYLNHDPMMTLTYFKARSTWVAYVFEWVDLLKCHLKGKTCRILANGQDIDYPEKKKIPGLHLPLYWDCFL